METWRPVQGEPSCYLSEKWLCRWWCHILLAWTYFQHLSNWGSAPCLCDRVVFSMLCCEKTLFHTGLLFLLSFSVSVLCHFPLPFLSWLDSISGKVMAAGAAGLIFPLRPSAYVYFEWFTCSIIGTLTLKLEWELWAGEGERWQLMEKRGSCRQMRLWGGKEGKKKRGEERTWQIWQSCQLFSGGQTAAHLERISKLENLTRNKGEGGERKEEREGPTGESLLCYSTPSLCLNYVSFCGRGTGLPPCSSLLLLPSLPSPLSWLQVSHPAGGLGVSLSISASSLCSYLTTSSAFRLPALNVL